MLVRVGQAFGKVDMKRVILAALLLGCGASQQHQTLSGIAQIVVVDTSALREQVYVDLDRSCREEFPPADHAFEDWRRCMAPAYSLDTATAVMERVLLIAEHLVDSNGTLGSYADIVMSAVGDVIVSLREIGVEVPEELSALLRVVGGLR